MLKKDPSSKELYVCYACNGDGVIKKKTDGKEIPCLVCNGAGEARCVEVWRYRYKPPASKQVMTYLDSVPEENVTYNIYLMEIGNTKDGAGHGRVIAGMKGEMLIAGTIFASTYGLRPIFWVRAGLVVDAVRNGDEGYGTVTSVILDTKKKPYGIRSSSLYKFKFRGHEITDVEPLRSTTVEFPREAALAAIKKTYEPWANIPVYCEQAVESNKPHTAFH